MGQGVDLTTLGIKIETQGVAEANRNLDSLEKSGTKTGQALDKLKDTSIKASDGMAGAGKGADSLSSAMSGVAASVALAAASFAAYKLADYARDAATIAGRYETLGVVMKTVGMNAGYTSTQMASFASGVAASGISLNESRNSLVKMAAAQLDLSKSSQLARVAQDAAVIANVNSSEAFDKIVQGITTGQAILLHHMGIMVNFESAYVKAAAAMGKTSAELTDQEKLFIRNNAVIEEESKRAGVYASAMDTAGKQLLSFTRYLEDFHTTFGTAFNPATSVTVTAMTDAMKKMQAVIERPQSQAALTGLGNAFAALAVTLSGKLPGALDTAMVSLGKLVAIWNSMPESLKGAVAYGMIGAGGGGALGTGIGLITGPGALATGATGTMIGGLGGALYGTIDAGLNGFSLEGQTRKSRTYYGSLYDKYVNQGDRQTDPTGRWVTKEELDAAGNDYLAKQSLSSSRFLTGGTAVISSGYQDAGQRANGAEQAQADLIKAQQATAANQAGMALGTQNLMGRIGTGQGLGLGTQLDLISKSWDTQIDALTKQRDAVSVSSRGQGDPALQAAQQALDLAKQKKAVEMQAAIDADTAAKKALDQERLKLEIAKDGANKMTLANQKAVEVAEKSLQGDEFGKEMANNAQNYAKGLEEVAKKSKELEKAGVDKSFIEKFAAENTALLKRKEVIEDLITAQKNYNTQIQFWIDYESALADVTGDVSHKINSDTMAIEAKKNAALDKNRNDSSIPFWQRADKEKQIVDLADQQKDISSKRTRAGQDMADSKNRQIMAQYAGDIQGVNAALRDQAQIELDLAQTESDRTVAMEKLRRAQEKVDNPVSSGALRGFEQYRDTAIDISANIQQAIVGSMNNAENALVKFCTTGKISIKDFASSVAADLARIGMRQALGSLINLGLSAAGSYFGSFGSAPNTQAFSSGSTIGTALWHAKGDVLTGPGISQYRNQIVNQPTYFWSQGGVPGHVMGEKPGSPGEAIMPLTRTASGDLGVKSVGGGGEVNISIVVNAETGQTDMKKSGAGAGADNMQKLGELIAGQTRVTIVQEQRPGGLLWGK